MQAGTPELMSQRSGFHDCSIPDSIETAVASVFPRLAQSLRVTPQPGRFVDSSQDKQTCLLSAPAWKVTCLPH